MSDVTAEIHLTELWVSSLLDILWHTAKLRLTITLPGQGKYVTEIKEETQEKVNKI